MKRTKRFTVRRIALGVAIVAILAPAAQAKPTPAKKEQRSVEVTAVKLGPGEMPYVSRTTVKLGAGEIPYVDDGAVTPSTRQTQATTADNGSDVGFGLASGGVIVLALVGGLGLVAIRKSRNAKLAPA